jgi:flagellar motor switch/type III secretory pathway protein FliN
VIRAVRDWLPIEAVAGEAARSVLDTAVRDWCSAFFARRPFRVDRIKPVPAGARSSEGPAWRSYSSNVAISVQRLTAGQLVARALDADLGAVAVSDQDRLLLDAFERKLFAELAAKIEAALGSMDRAYDSPREIADPFGPEGGAVAILAEDNGARLMSLALPGRVLLPLCKRSISPSSPSKGRLKSPASALAPTEVVVEATLGSAEIALADLRDLAPGDVLVLNRALGEPADIRLKGAETVIARARLIEVGGQMALSLQARGS